MDRFNGPNVGSGALGGETNRYPGRTAILRPSPRGTEAKRAKGDGTNNLRPGKRTPVEVRREKAKQMRASGYSYGEIADTLGISRSYAYKLVNGSD